MKRGQVEGAGPFPDEENRVAGNTVQQIPARFSRIRDCIAIYDKGVLVVRLCGNQIRLYDLKAASGALPARHVRSTRDKPAGR